MTRLVSGGQVSMVALSASALLGDQSALRATTDEVGAACNESGVGLCSVAQVHGQPILYTVSA